MLPSARVIAAAAAGPSASSAQDQSASPKKKSAKKRRPDASGKKKDSANKRRPKGSASSKSSGEKRSKSRRPSSAKRKRRPAPKAPELQTLPVADWASLATEISLSSSTLGENSRTTAARLGRVEGRGEIQLDRRYRLKGDEKRVRQLRLDLEDNRNDLGTIRRLADMERRNHRFEPAVGHLLNALRLRPLSQELHIELAQLYASNGRLPQAYSAYQEVVYLNVDHPEARLAQSRIRDMQGDHGAAERLLDEATIQSGRTSVYFVYQVYHLSAIGEHRNAITTGSEGLQSYPDEDRLYEARGSAYAALGMIGEARVDYYDGLALNPDNVAVLRLLGNLSEIEHEAEVAVRSYTKVLEHEPGDRDASLGLGRSLLMDLQLSAAVEELSLYRELHRPDPESDQLLSQAYYLSAIVASDQSNFRQALEYQSASRKLNGSQSPDWAVPALLWAGRAERLHGRDYHAVAYYSRAVRMDPFNITGHRGLSMAYEAVGENAKAGYHLDEAQRLKRVMRRDQPQDYFPSP